MQQTNAKVVFSGNELKVVLPLTNPSGKIRIKKRNSFSEYGIPVAGRSQKLSLSDYIEWQVSYDLPAKKSMPSSLRGMNFTSNKGVRKCAYEFTELLYYSVKSGIVEMPEVENMYCRIGALKDAETLEMCEEMAICRTNPHLESINGMDFYRMVVKHPMLVHRFGQYDICAEVVMREQQHAVSTQPMLYLCLPITALRYNRNIVGRTLDLKETADWIVGRDEAMLVLETLRILGMLSPKHKFDILAIFKMLFPELPG